MRIVYITIALAILYSCSAFAHEPSEASQHGLTAPVLLERVEPHYPEEARKTGLGGTVGLEIGVGADGAVTGVKVVHGVGFGFDEEAVEAAEKFKFRPATQDGKPIASTVLFDQQFVVRPHLMAETSAEPTPTEEMVQPTIISAQKPAENKYESTVLGRGPSSAASASTIRNLDFDLRPKTSPNDILRVVPGLLAVQHQGGGKADQLFLRGFDADHGTDVGIFVDGVPVNMPSHAHGQGFADLHWMIPEAIEQIDVVKGPYDARFGDFSTAGAVNLVTRKDFAESFGSFTVGGFPTQGCSGGWSGCKLIAQERGLIVYAPHFSGWAEKLHPWVAAEVARDQGPFTAPENLERYNIFAKLTYDITPRTSMGIFFQAYGSSWTGSGQIPQRDVARIGQFGSEDPSEGGTTERQMFTFFVKHKDPKNEFDLTIYATRYRLNLFNDFTFYLRDPVNGDEIEQDDRRVFTGANVAFHRHTDWRGISFRQTVGAQIRYDGVHVDLWNVESSAVDGQMGPDYRKRLSRYVDPTGATSFGNNDDIDQINLSVYAEEDVVWTRWFRSIIGLRADYFGFSVDDHGETLGGGNPKTSGSKQKSLLSPKATFVFTPIRPFDIYLNFGMGFHSNDARVAVQSSQYTPDHSPILAVPRIYGGELGARYTWKQYLSVATAFWASYLENETIFDADVGQFVPSDPTRRLGIDFEVRAHPIQCLYVDYDLAYANAHSLPAHGSGGDLALAPKLYMTAGISYIGTGKLKGLRGRFGMRYLGARPVFDTDSAQYTMYNSTDPDRVNAQGYTIFDLSGAYRVKWVEFGFNIQNLFNSTWREAQFGNESCTYDESHNAKNPNYAVCGPVGSTGGPVTQAQRTGVTDVHFTPGVPFNLQLTAKAYF